MGPIIFILLLPSRVADFSSLFFHSVSQPSFRHFTHLAVCLLLKYAQSFTQSGLKYSFITPVYDLFVSFIKDLPPLTVFSLSNCSPAVFSYWLKPTGGQKVHSPQPPVDLKPITPAQRVPKTYRRSSDSLPLS